MTGFRPTASEMEPTASIEIASIAVVDDTARLLCAAPIPNSRENSGRSGWTQYRSAKVEKPAAKTARFVRLNAGVPRSICPALSMPPKLMPLANPTPHDARRAHVARTQRPQGHIRQTSLPCR